MVFEGIKAVVEDPDRQPIPENRLQLLDTLAGHLIGLLKTGGPISLNFICTHNSRRSQLSQVWAQTLASYYQIPEVYCYSGGTEATAIPQSVVKVWEKSGFQVQALSNGPNPVYAIKYDLLAPAIIGFSKIWEDPFNPPRGFIAVMTCAEADVNCPFVAGAAARAALPYKDPKEADSRPDPLPEYEAVSDQIAMEWRYIWTQIKSNG